MQHWLYTKRRYKVVLDYELSIVQLAFMWYPFNVLSTRMIHLETAVLVVVQLVHLVVKLLRRA